MDTASPPTTVVGPVIVQPLQFWALPELGLEATQQFEFDTVPLSTKMALGAVGSRARMQALLVCGNAAIAVVAT